MKSYKSLGRFMGIWLLASLIIIGWVAFNVIVVLTPFWLDVAYATVLIIALMRWAVEPASWLTKHRLVRWSSWIVIGLAVLLGILWAVQSFLNEPPNTPALNLVYSLPQQLSVIEGPLVQSLEQLYGRYQSGDDLISTTFIQLGWASLTFGLAAIAVAIAGRVAWISIEPILTPYLETWQLKYAIRPGRWLARLRRVLVIGFVLILAAFGLAMEANTRIPQMKWQTSVTGPNTPPSVFAVVWDSAREQLYIGTDGGVFRSDDDGQSWQSASSGLTKLGVKTLVWGVDQERLYAGTWGGGVFFSDDGGQSWQNISIDMANTDVLALVWDETRERLYAGTNGEGVFRSDNGGQSWQSVNTDLPSRHVKTLIGDAAQERLYAGTSGGGIFYSDDGGQSWQNGSIGLSDIDVLALVWNVTQGRLYAGTNGRGVFRSDDGGQSWQNFSTDLTDMDVQTLMWDATQGRIYAGTNGGGVLYSDDGGQSWQNGSAGLTSTNVLVLGWYADQGRLYAGTHGGGIYRSDDGGESWQNGNAGLTSTNIQVLIWDADQRRLYAGTYGGGVFRSDDSGLSWQSANAGLSNTNVQALVWDADQRRLYAGTSGGGVFYSDDGGQSWQSTSTGLTSANIQVLAWDADQGRVYAGVLGRGVFRSKDDGQLWQNISTDLTNMEDVQTLVRDVDNGWLYVGLGNGFGSNGGVFRSEDDGQSWQSISTELIDTDVRNLVWDATQERLYAGTYGKGVFRTDDGGQSWQSVSAGLTNMDVRDLVWDTARKRLFAATNDGVFRTDDGGQSWQSTSAGLTHTIVEDLAWDAVQGRLYAGTYGGGVFRSDDGQSWQSTSASLSDTGVLALTWDATQNRLYTVRAQSRAFTLINSSERVEIGVGVSRSDDGGQSWQSVSAGLTDVNVQTLAWDAAQEHLYAGTLNEGVFRSDDGGQSWQSVSAELIDTDVRDLVWDALKGRLYVGAWNRSVLHSDDGGASWQKSNIFTSQTLFDLISNSSNYGTVHRLPDNTLIWSTYGADGLWMYVVNNLRLRQAIIQPLPDGRAVIWTAWGSTLVRVDLAPNYNKIPLAWLAMRAWVWQATFWLKANMLWIGGVLALMTILIVAFSLANLVRPYSVPLWATLLARRRLDTYASPTSLKQVWPDWSRMVRTELLNYGNVIAADLRHIPGPFRRYTLRHYAQIYQATQLLEIQPKRLRLLTGDRLGRWRRAWQTAGRSLTGQAIMPSNAQAEVADLASTLAEVLGFRLGPVRDFEAVRAYPVTAPTLRLNLPPRFSLIFVADPQPGPATVQMLVDAIEVMGEKSYFALVIPLEPARSQVDIVAELRQAIARSPHVQDFIVLSQDDILDMLISRQPVRVLTQCILSQVDLAVVSPFVVSGPVPETMFFGREAKTKTLVEGVKNTDFAVIGNRKIGKTSLLRRALTRLQADERVHPLWVDCQTVRTAADFFAAFAAQTKLPLPASTPEGFRTALTTLRQQGPLPVLLIDEVDMLLANEKESGESLVAMWRALAQAGTCHFIFCGSTGLARRLDDARSAFFNFPQPLLLGYLTPKIARQVLTQPLETLGLVVEDEDTLVTETLALTSGHPNFIQYAGRGLVEAANHRQERVVLPADLAAIRASTDFTDYYLKTIWGEAGPLEKLITLVAPTGGFRVDDLETLLAAEGVRVSEEQVDAALKILQIYAVLEKREREYTFVPQAFFEILHRTQEVARLIRQEKRRLAE